MMAKDELLITLHQTSPLLGETEANREEIQSCVQASMDRDLIVFPELSLTGYGLRSQVNRRALNLEEGLPIQLPPGAPPTTVGFPERGEDELVYNTAALIHGQEILARHRKVYLPTYGLFDEGRFFAAGKEPPPVAALPCGWTVGLLVCEDFWHPALLYLLAAQGAEVVVVMAAAPGRGNPGASPESEPEGQLFSSTETWTLLARTAAIQYGVFLVLANRGGVEGGVSFAGDSLVVGPCGEILARAPQADSATLEVTLARGDLRRARTPYSHLRDEDPAYVRRALDSILDPQRET